jgi:hypothetical protein
MAFQFAPTTNVSSPAFNAPQSAQMGAPVNANPLSSLADITNIAATQQNTKASQLATQKAAETYASDVAKAQAESKLAQTNAQSAQVKLGNEQINSMYTVLTPYGSDPRVEAAGQLTANATPEQIKAVQNGLYDIGDEVKQKLTSMGWSKADVMQYVHDFDASVMKDPRQAPNLITRATQSLAGALNIAQQNQPQIERNAANQFVQINKAKATVAPLTNQNYNPNPSMAEVGMANKQAETYAGDFTAAQKDASEALPRIALFQNIKKLAPEAFTGVGGARKELATGIANAIGIDIYTAEKTATDELAKNSALLSMVGGNTDAARLLAEAANPNKKMTKDAINEVADQMIGVEKLKQAKAKYLAPFANDPQKYAQALNTFNEVNDFRIFQEATPEQVRRLKSSMSKEAQVEMSKKISKARQLGLL